MDADDSDLIRQLCTLTGMLLEDASAEALLMPADHAQTLHLVVRKSEDAAALLRAAEVLGRGAL